MSRLEQFRRDGRPVVMPENPLPYITDRLFEIGPVIPAGMGSGMVTWRDLSAWQDVTGIRLQAWEGRLLRRLSGVYLEQSRKSEKPDCPAPWMDGDEIAASRDRVASGLKAMFKAMAKDGKGR